MSETLKLIESFEEIPAEILEETDGRGEDKEKRSGIQNCSAVSKTYTNSPLVVYTDITPHKSSPREANIDTITIHCMAGNLSVETCGALFHRKNGSSNYGIGTDGRIALYVDEKDRSWCSNSNTNDARAITIEVANDGGKETGWHISDKALASLIDLVTDVCKRNGIASLKWSIKKADRVNHKNGCNMTAHRDYAAKACPGDYIFSLEGKIAEEVNKRLAGGPTPEPTPTPTPTPTPDPGLPYKVRVTCAVLNIRKGPGLNYKVTGQIKDKGIYTIVAEDKTGALPWGKLKSGAGWICLNYTKKL